ncbi:MAG: methyltransferase domain-containing protein [bacterium]|nr:MAG: methyltransferase domain-containing protein [bacterium]
MKKKLFIISDHQKKIVCRDSLLVLLLQLILFTSAQCQRDQWQQPERVMDSLRIQPGMVIGEAGAGEGYFTFKLSQRIGENGIIYANDINQDKLDELQRQMKQDSITNIIPVLGKIEDPCFPDSLLDMVIMVYVLHDVEKPVAFLENIKLYLKNGAPVVIVDRDPDKFGGRTGHFLPREDIEKILRESGYTIDRVMTFLSRDNIYVIYPNLHEGSYVE